MRSRGGDVMGGRIVMGPAIVFPELVGPSPKEACSECASLRARVAELEKALEWYAKDEQYEVMYGSLGAAIRWDHGRRARQALGRSP